MASLNDSSFHPVPTPRKKVNLNAEHKPVPKPRTTISNDTASSQTIPDIVDNDVLSKISFASPLEEEGNRGTIYENYPLPSFSQDESSDLPTILSNASSLPPSHAPPPLPDESVYERPKSQHKNISSPFFDESLEYFINVPDIKTKDPFTIVSESANAEENASTSFELLHPRKIKPPRNEEEPVSACSRPSQSVLFNFDPLYENIFSQQWATKSEATNGCLVEECIYEEEEEERENKAISNTRAMKSSSRLGEIKYSASSRAESNDYSIESEEEIFPEDLPPQVPLRVDSIPREDMSRIASALISPEPGTSQAQSQPKTSQPFLSLASIQAGKAPEKQRKSVAFPTFATMKEFTMKNLLNRPSSTHKNLLSNKSIGRPTFGIVTTSDIKQRGKLIQPGRDRTDMTVMLGDGALSWTSEKGVSSSIMLMHLTSITSFSAQGPGSVPLHCFEVASWNEKSGGSIQLFAAASYSERALWNQKLLESTTSVFPASLTKGYTSAGWVYIKEAVSGCWVPCWLLLSLRELFYCVQEGKVLEADLRKARCIVQQSSEDLEEGALSFLIDLQGRSLYIQALTERDTKRWCKCISRAAQSNGRALAQQQLTKDDVPVIVDKCINFVCAHGSLTEGIYRHSGTSSKVQELLAKFKKDAWSVQLARQEYREHEVANALKRFFMDLPEPLLTSNITNQLCRIAVKERPEEEKVPKYQQLLQKLSPIQYVTARRLFGHLHFLHLQSEKNLMNAQNLSTIWGLTLMHQDREDDPMPGFVQSAVVKDLILLYPPLFNVDKVEMEREMHVLQVLEKYHTAGPSQQPSSTVKPSGDLRIWVSMGKPSSSKTIQISIGPQKTAAQVTEELAPGEAVMLQEFVCGYSLARTLHPSEKVLDVVIRWGYWDDVDRKDNQLVLGPCGVYLEILPLAVPPLIACGELKFADTRSKNFKNYVFELSQAKLTYYKDRKFSSKIGDWNIEDIIWYLGHEPKRDPCQKWSITFISRKTVPKRSKDSPFFGCTIAGNSRDEMLRWCAAMLLAEYPDGLLLSQRSK